MNNSLENLKVNVRLKLSGLLISVIFLYIYADYFGLHIPRHLEGIMSREVTGFLITDVWLSTVSILMIIPSLIIFLSLILILKVNHGVNIVIGLFNIGLTFISGFTGETWPFFMLFSFIEAVLLALIVWFVFMANTGSLLNYGRYANNIIRTMGGSNALLFTGRCFTNICW